MNKIIQLVNGQIRILNYFCLKWKLVLLCKPLFSKENQTQNNFLKTSEKIYSYDKQEM